MKKWERKTPENFLQLPPTFPVCPAHLFSEEYTNCKSINVSSDSKFILFLKQRKAPSQVNGSLQLISVFCDTFCCLWNSEFHLAIGSKAIEKWEGKDVVLPPCIEIWGRGQCPIACSTLVWLLVQYSQLSESFV